MMGYEEFLEQGETLAEEGLVEEALARFEQALAEAPGNPEAVEAVGRALMNLGRLEEAEERFREALALDPEWAAPHIDLAFLAMRREEPFKVVHHLERAIEADPELPEAYVELGRYYGLMGEPELARATFERWTSANPEDADVLIEAGLTLFDAGEYADALGFFESAAEAAGSEEQRSAALTYRANALDMLGRYEEAVAGYEGVISQNPSWWEAHANLGICHDRNGEREKAEAAFRRGLEECPGSPELRDELAAHYLAENRNLKEALALSEEAVALGRDEVRHLYTLGEVRAALHDDAGAEEAYRAVLTLDPEDPEARVELGLIYERRGRISEAEEQFMEALKRDPNNPRALHSYAGLYYSAGDEAMAERLLERALTSDPGYAPALSALSGLKAGQGDREGALRLMRRAIEAGERDRSYFENAPEFAALRGDAVFTALLERMDEAEGSP